MPVTIKKGEFNYKDPDTGNYKGVDVIGERTTAEQIAAIQKKGEDVLESIPDDYTNLSNQADTYFKYISDLSMGELPDGTIKYPGTPLSGEEVSGYAWRITKTTTAGDAYKYVNYTFPASYAYQIFIVTGHSWSQVYPLISFYDSNDDLISYYGEEGDTQYTTEFIPIPKNAVRCVVNGRTGQDVIVNGLSKSSVVTNISNRLMPYARSVNQTVLENNPTYNYIRNWPCNYIYSLASDTASLILDLPDGLINYATIIKFNGNTLRSSMGYSLYIAMNTTDIWFGWDNGDRIYWTRSGLKSFPSSNVYDDYENVTGTVTTGKALNKNGTTEASHETYVYITYEVQSGDRLYISGYHYANGYPLFIVFDSSDNVIYTPSYGDTGHCRSVSYNVPNNASYIVVNGEMRKNNGGNGYPDLKRLACSENLHVSIKKNGIKRRYLFVGDSYCEGYSHDGNNSGWATYCAGYLGLDSSDYVRAYYGGARFSNSSNTFEQRVPLNYPADYFTDVVVCGGYNDNSYTEEQILAGISSFANLIKTKYPYAKLHIGFVAWNKAGNGSGAIENWQEIHSRLLSTVMPAYQKCTAYGAAYMNNVEYWINDSLITNSDGYHPGEAGNRSIGQAVAHALLSGSAPLPHNESYRVGS